MNNNRQMLWCFVVAMIGFSLLYHFWFYILGALAIFGGFHLYREYLRNKHKR